MALTPTPIGDYHVLVQIELTGLTLYYADRNLSMSDGNYYDGRLRVSSLQRAFSSFLEPKQRQSTLTITLKDEDLTIRGLLEDYTWGNRTVKVYVGKGRDLADYSVDFNGIVKFPGGVSFDRHEVQIKLRDVRNRDVVDMPPNAFWTTNYPNLEPAAEGQPIPVAYGDLSDAWCPVWCTDTTTNEFKIADHAIKSIEAVTKNGEVTAWSNENLTNATFRISSYTPGTDEVAVKFKGKVDGGGDLIENPVDILRDIQENYIGIDAANIDTDAYDDLKIDLEYFKARRYINEPISSDTLIAEMGIECLFDLFVDDDQYTVRSRQPSIVIDREFDDSSIAQKSLRVEADPENLYANRIKCEFGYVPLTEKYSGYIQEDQEAEQKRVGQVLPRTITFKWLYLTVNVRTIAQHLILLYSKEIAVIKVTLYGDGILTKLADRLGLTTAHYQNRPLVVRELSKHFETMSCTVWGYDEIKHVLPGYWTADDAPTYDDATDEERASMGFFTNDDGEAKPGDEESKVSHWW